METKSNLITDLMGQGVRVVFMLAFWIVSRIALTIVFVLALFQLICTLITRRPNEKILRFGRSLGAYVSQIVDFLTYNTDQKPWPFQDWPDSTIVVWKGTEND